MHCYLLFFRFLFTVLISDLRIGRQAEPRPLEPLLPHVLCTCLFVEELLERLKFATHHRLQNKNSEIPTAPMLYEQLARLDNRFVETVCALQYEGIKRLKKDFFSDLFLQLA